MSPQAYRREEDLERKLRPLKLDEFIGQQKIKRNLRIFMEAALQRGESLDHVLLSGPPGLGKCITADSLILTDRGCRRMEDLLPSGLRPGESRPLEITIYGVHGLEKTSHVYASGRVPTRRLRTHAGFVLEGTGRHPILAASREGLQWKWLEDLAPNDFVAIGCGLGDGGQSAPTGVTCASLPRRASTTKGGGMMVGVAAPTIQEAYKMGAQAASDERVDACIRESPRSVVLAYARGLAAASAPGSAGPVELCVNAEALSQEIQIILAHLGIVGQRYADAEGWKLFFGADNWRAFLAGQGGSTSCVPFASDLLGVPPQAGGPSRADIAHFLAHIPVDQLGAPAHLNLRTLSSELLYWDRVAEISASEALAYDFVVPGTHSFVGNGFFNHNTTLGHIIAEEMGASITTTSGPVLDKPASIAGILTKLNEGDVLFIDEIHRLAPIVEEYLYSAMEDYYIDIVIDSGPNARSIKLTLPPFTLVGATTRKGLLTAPLRARFGIDFRYDYYTAELLHQILLRSARILSVGIDSEGAAEIARRSRGTPRIANRLLRRARDFAQVEFDGRITRQIADRALTALDVDQEGLDDMDARILTTLIEKFGGGPAGLSNLAVSVGEDAGTIEEVYEPYLIQEGYLQRTPRGRVATVRSYVHFGLTDDSRPKDLFS